MARPAFHQVVVSATPGDAITDCALLLRRWLRQMGFTSQIFAQSVHSALAREARPLAAYRPRRAGQWLIYHHSIGSSVVEWLFHLPQRLIVIYGASADHATPQLMDALLAGADRAIATQAQHPRAADPAWLQARAAELGYRVEVSEAVSQAMDAALAGAEADDLVLCTGSVFVAGDARSAWFAQQGNPLPPSDPV